MNYSMFGKEELSNVERGWSGGAKVLDTLPVPGRPTSLITVGEGPTALAVGAGCWDIFTLNYPFSRLSPSRWETVRYRLKYCLNLPLNPRQPTNQIKCRVIGERQHELGLEIPCIYTFKGNEKDTSALISLLKS